MSRVLAITTSTPCTGCALWGDDGPMGSLTSVAAHRHAEVLMPSVDQLCRNAGVGPGDLDAVAVDIGPGLFTGLRVGVSAANSIALARGLPVLAVSSLEVLAHPHRRTAGFVASVVDARRSEVYWATYRTGERDGAPAITEISSPAVGPAGELAAQLQQLGAPVLAVGDGAQRYREVLEKHAEVGPALSGSELWPSPLVVAELGRRLLREGVAGTGRPATPGSLAQPLYLRHADVRIGWDQLGGRVTPPSAQGS